MERDQDLRKPAIAWMCFVYCFDVNEVKSVDLMKKKKEKKEKKLEPIILLNWHQSGIAWKSAAQIFSYYQSSWGLNEVERALLVNRSWGYGLMELHKHEYTVSQKRIRPIIFKKAKLD